MVLEAAFDDSPQSDFDPYTSNPDSRPEASPTALHINLAHASRPFPILGPLSGFNNRHLVELVSGIAREAPKVIERPLTQDEVDACVSSVSKYMQIHSWIYCNGLILGGFRAQATKADMTFPGEKWLKSKNIKFSLNFEQFGPLKGAASRVAWNVVRSSIWLAWWGVPAYILGGVAGQIAMAQQQTTDERLKQFRQDMHKDGVKRKVEVAVKRRQAGLPSFPGEEQPEGQVDIPSQLDTQSSRGVLQRTQRDASQDTRSDQREAVSQYPAGASKDNDSFGFQSQDEPLAFSTSEQSNSASGTGGSAWDRVRNQAGQRESAWDRVRRQGGSADASVSSNSWQARASNGGGNTPLTDSFTFDEREEDRQSARSEAQRDFNARIERERQGKDFNDSKSGRW
jgi:hypothetical protein